MATHTGDEGSVAIGANTIAEVMSFTLNENIELLDDSAKGDVSKTHLNGKKDWDGTIEAHFDETDTTGQVAMVVGASVTLNLFLMGTATGDTTFTGTATINSVSFDSPEDGIVGANFTFTGNGDLTRGVVS